MDRILYLLVYIGFFCGLLGLAGWATELIAKVFNQLFH